MLLAPAVQLGRSGGLEALRGGGYSLGKYLTCGWEQKAELSW